VFVRLSETTFRKCKMHMSFLHAKVVSPKNRVENHLANPSLHWAVARRRLLQKNHFRPARNYLPRAITNLGTLCERGV
jgi:hypothetical protein